MFCICYACDNNYALQTGVSMISLFEKNPNLDAIDTFVFEDRVSTENKQRLKKIAESFNRNLYFISTEEIIFKIKQMDLTSNVDNGSLSTFSRLFFKNYIPKTYDTLIYIDADTMIMGEIDELISYKNDKPLAAVVDTMSSKYKGIIGHQKDEPYFNAGVLAINLRLWEKKNCEERILDHISNKYNKYLYADQDVINIVLKNEINVLPLAFNSFPFYSSLNYKSLIKFIDGGDYYSLNEYEEAGNSPKIIHFVYSVWDRPWFEGNLNIYSNIWDSYVAKTDWKVCKKRRRKIFSRTRILQLIYKLFGSKAVLCTMHRRNIRKFKKIKKEYRKAGLYEYDKNI